MYYDLSFYRYNERSILISWPEKINENILNDILNFKKTISEKSIKQIVDIIHAYSSILIIYKHTIDNFNDEYFKLKELYMASQSSVVLKKTTWEIPVCYDLEFGVDLKFICNLINLSPYDVIRIHSAPVYTVYFLGFLPGFPYLGGLDSRLFLERKSEPKLNVAKGSVAIGANQTGIYPQDSPGGWHIIGKTPIDLFTPKRKPLTFIDAGDKIRFVPISIKEFYKIDALVKSSDYILKPIQSHD
ncbi:5-oxoprolinase subunit PxpB [Winogradskyella sp. DF17]|uniref:5-oxoprolinase subunit PxpB n=1 Tax=Winogradskyella pelagia TaxID=2819984 RepID=A0ABS3T3Z0_9FLAO|nr:5-oxoprolinase subunit PxpB [Winogradskyella sp. DF17]MBO3117463.1 5-oxoprolinase subunit PxpB [Winogradskyella sp. DF17]